MKRSPIVNPAPLMIGTCPIYWAGDRKSDRLRPDWSPVETGDISVAADGLIFLAVKGEAFEVTWQRAPLSVATSVVDALEALAGGEDPMAKRIRGFYGDDERRKFPTYTWKASP